MTGATSQAFLLALALLATPGVAWAGFTNVASSVGLALGNDKDGGATWADFNNDGFPDLLVNTDTNNTAHRTRIYMHNGTASLLSWTDRTAAMAPGLRTRDPAERSAIVADLNHDGYLDFARNSSSPVEIWLSNGPDNSGDYSFGLTGGDVPDQVIDNSFTPGEGTFNTEGMGFVDYDNDGWLDLLVDNHESGTYSFRNSQGATLPFVWDGTPQPSGLPLSGASDGDYAAFTDFNVDGYVDLGLRKRNDPDLYLNDGDGTFSSYNPFYFQADNGDKGGSIFCDFDDDGDFDFFWGHGERAGGYLDPNQVVQNNGVSWSALGILPGMDHDTDVQGVGCADVDNDGDLDLYVANASGDDFLFTNTSSGGSITFSPSIAVTPMGENDSEGVAFADVDLDGDMDLHVNVDNNPNELWLNDTGGDDYLMVRVWADVSSTVSPGCLEDEDRVLRDDLGATLRLLNGDLTPAQRQGPRHPGLLPGALRPSRRTRRGLRGRGELQLHDRRAEGAGAHPGDPRRPRRLPTPGDRLERSRQRWDPQRGRDRRRGGPGCRRPGRGRLSGLVGCRRRRRWHPR
jgi:hypothetical protein